MRRRITRLIGAWMLGCALLALALTYYGLARADQLAADPGNPRVQALARSVRRGAVTLRDGNPIARSTEADPTLRVWMGPDSLSPLVGYASPVMGSAGLEAAYDAWLIGLRYDFRRTGLLYTLLGTPERGFDVELTVDRRVQNACEEALAGRRGAAVVMDAVTGEILAAASSPWISPPQLEQSWERVMAREDSPMLCRATSGLYPPGSSLKPALAAAAFDMGVLDPHAVWQCDGAIQAGHSTISDSTGAHGDVVLDGAVAMSCNTFFVQLVLRAGAGIRDRLAKMHLTAAHSLGLPSARASLGKPDASSESLAQLAIGQGDMLVTPLHMAAVYAAIANRGVMMRPLLAARVLNSAGREVHRWVPKRLGSVMSPEASICVESALRAAVDWGTAQGAELVGEQVFGKTGTAQNPGGEPHSWFCGYVRVPGGTAALALVVENAGSGGAVAAPLARDILRVVAEGRWGHGR